MTGEEWATIGLSIRVALIATAVVFIPAAAIAYGLARRRLPFSFVVENLVQLPLVLPPVATGLILLYVLSPGRPVGAFLDRVGVPIVFSGAGAALAAAVVSFPIVVNTMRAAFEQIDPALEEAGYVYGGTRAQVFRAVVLPLASRGMLAAAIIGFARAVGEFGATIVVAGSIPGRTQTIPLAIYRSLSEVGGDAAALRLLAASVVISAVSLVAYSMVSRRLFAFGATKTP